MTGGSLLQGIVQHPDIVTPPNHAGEAKAWCPWHPDRAGGKPSLGINVQKKVVKCWVCGEGGVRKLAQAWGIAKPPATVKANRPPWEREIDRTFDYNNPDGSVLFQVVRFKVPTGADKDIMQRRRDPSDTSKWVWNLKGVRPILYELPRLRAADPEARVLIPEGERPTLTGSESPVLWPPPTPWALGSGGAITTRSSRAGTS